MSERDVTRVWVGTRVWAKRKQGMSEVLLRHETLPEMFWGDSCKC